MTAAACANPISSADLFDYWAGELESRDEERIEEHVFACATCAATLAGAEALAGAVRALVRSGAFQALVSDSLLNRLARDGARIRTFTLGPGDVVPCAVWSDDEVLVARLRGNFSDVGAVSMLATLATGQELSRSENVAARPGQHELIYAISAEWVRQLPATTVRIRVTDSGDGEKQLLGEYTLTHAGSLSHG